MLNLANILWYEARSIDRSAEELAVMDEERHSLVQRALSIAPNDAVANAYMSYHSLVREHDAQMAARYIQRALELDPVHQEVHRVAGFMADVLNLEVDRIELASRTLSRDVLCVQCLDLLAEAYDDIGETDKAREVRQRRIDLAGGEAGNYRLAYSQMDIDPATALAFFQSQPVEHGIDPLAPQVELLVKLGRRDEVLQVQQRILEEWGEKAAYWVAVGFAQLGEVEKSWEWLLRALAKDPDLFVFIYEGEDFPGLRNTQRWKDLRHKMGLAEEQLTAVKFEMPKLGPE